MANGEGRRWNGVTEIGGSEWISQLRIPAEFREPVFLVLMGSVMLTFLAVGHQLGLW